jgi:hypothetical protein
MVPDKLPEPAHVYWAPPLPASSGDDYPDAIHLEVGRALAAWEGVEEVFAALFGCFVDADTWAADRAFGSVASSSTRREMLLNAASVFFETNCVLVPYVEWFSDVMKHYQSAPARRNEIAHALVRMDGNKYFLTPPDYSTRKTKVDLRPRGHPLPPYVQPSYKYSASNVAEFRERFNCLRFAVWQYMQTLSANYSNHR